MQEALVYSLPLALVIALSPLPMALSISVLLTSQPNNAASLLLGWSASILTIGFIVLVIPGLDTDKGEPSQLAGWFRIAMGAGLVFIGMRMWQRRVKDQGEVEEPKLLSRLESASPGKILVTGFTLSALNPKNLLLTLAGASYIDAYSSTLSEQSLALLVFTSIASISVGAPIVVYKLFPGRAERALNNFKGWLIRNNQAVVGMLLFVFGLVITINGLSILFSFH